MMAEKDELREFFIVVYRALKMITAYIKRRYGLKDD